MSEFDERSKALYLKTELSIAQKPLMLKEDKFLVFLRKRRKFAIYIKVVSEDEILQLWHHLA